MGGEAGRGGRQPECVIRQVTQRAMAAWSCQAALGGRAEHAFEAGHQSKEAVDLPPQAPPSTLRAAPGGAEPSGRRVLRDGQGLTGFTNKVTER